HSHLALHSFPTRRSSDLDCTMDLFSCPQSDQNLLPFDGEVIYHGILLDANESERFFNVLMEKIDWYNDRSVIYGKEIITKRKVRSEEHTSELQSRENLVC